VSRRRSLADGEEAQLVGVVGDEQNPGANGLAVDLGPDAAVAPEPERSQPRKRLAPSAVPLAPADERRVGPERDVVQETALADPAEVDAALLSGERVERAGQVIAAEPEVAGEVVPRPVRHDHQREISLRGHACHRCDRAVASRNAQNVHLGRARDCGGIVAVAENGVQPRLPAPARRPRPLHAG